MDAFSLSHIPFYPFSPEINPAESSSTSDSDAELMLASRNPKKISGRKKYKETRHPVYRGVRMRNSSKWVSEVREPMKQSRVWLGSHPTAEMAARAHDVAVLAMRGRSACLNFADPVWRLPVPETSSVKDIQKAAAAAAKALRLTLDVVEVKELPEIVIYVDEETVFGMPGFLENLAEGLMIQPLQKVGYGDYEDVVEFDVGVSLWTLKKKRT